MTISSIAGYPLSPQQKRAWRLQEQNQSLCSSWCVVRFEGRINLVELTQAVQQVITRHEILRTGFQQAPGMDLPLQVIHPGGAPLIYHYDLSELEYNQQQQKRKELIAELNQAPIEFNQGIGVNLALITYSTTEHDLWIALPALCADWMSLKQIVSEICTIYTFGSIHDDLVEEPLQYADVATWQNELFETDEAAVGITFCKQQDFSALPNSLLPFTKPITELSEFSPQSYTFTIPEDLLHGVRSIAHRYQTTDAMVLFTCWQILLRRLTGQADLVIGFGCDGRNYEELQTALGLFAKYLPLRSNWEITHSLEQVLEQVNHAVRQITEWQETFTWETVIDLAMPSSGLSYFPIAFDFFDSFTFSGTGLTASIEQHHICLDRFHLKLSGIDQGDLFVLQLHYDPNVVSQVAVKQLAEQFHTLFTDAIHRSQIPIDQLNVLTNRDRYQLLVEFNSPFQNHNITQCVHQVFEQQVDRVPDRVAVVCDEQQLAYAELNANANQLANHLRQLGLRSTQQIGLYLERSVDCIVSILGILKAGAAYVPLDPTLPTERLKYMLEDADVAVLITQQHLKAQLPDLSLPIVCLDADREKINSSSPANLIDAIGIDELAYVIYTSGSTGHPKGVAVEHRHVLHYVNSILPQLDLPDGATFATVSSIATDLGNTAIFPALCSGGTLHLVPEGCTTNPDAFSAYCDRHPVDCLKITPSHLQALLTAAHPERLLPRQWLVLGGESCSWQLIERLHCYSTRCRILNHYGPTEATVGVLTWEVDPATLPVVQTWSKTVPIGRSLPHVQVYILNQHHQPVPIGVTGELYIGGQSLAREYINKSELTEERFIELELPSLDNSESHPVTGQLKHPKSVRLYKTGDLARWLPDGTIEFLGRVDNQVKLNGFRIELGEIEVVLAQHPAVQQSVVLVRHSDENHPRLVAYVVLKPGQANRDIHSLTVDLQVYLRQHLPEHMIPSRVMRLKALPLTPSGKLDRAALPQPQWTRSDQGGFVAPRTPVEQQLADIWKQVLRVEQVGIHDNFFELGGDSILSIQIIARASQAGLRLTPKQIFEYATIAQLATVVGSTESVQSEQELITGTAPLTPIQHWFFQQNFPNPHHFNQALLLETTASLNLEALRQAVNVLLHHHDALRLRFEQTASGWQQTHTAPEEQHLVAFFDLSDIPDEEYADVLSVRATEVQASLNLTKGPLLRVAVFDRSHHSIHQPKQVLIVVHHLVMDGVSWRILLADLETAYQQICQGQPVHLPAKTTSFQRWATQLYAYANLDTEQAAFTQEKQYWLDRAKIPVSPLPIDFHKGENSVALAQTISVELTPDETQAVLQVVPKCYRSQINDVLLTALVHAFQQWTGYSNLLVDLESHGREDLFPDIDLSRTIGWFTAVFSVWLEGGNSTTPAERLNLIKEQLRQVPKGGIGYGLLRYLRRDLVDTFYILPRAQVSFNYLGQFDSTIAASSLFNRSSLSPGATRSMQGDRTHLIDVNGYIADGKLYLDWVYSQGLHRQSTIERLAQNFLGALRSLITDAHTDSSTYTSADFPKARLNQSDLNTLIAKLSQTGGGTAQ
jgi:amino acid adenylation domain-containing protein/non-ribosomal peptide synthase protein (TIGR01720 family)